MLSSLISQLLLKSQPDMRIRFMEILKRGIREASHFKGSEVSEAVELQIRYKLLSEMLADYRPTGRVLILLDALDECSNPALLAKQLFNKSASLSTSADYTE